MTFKEANSDFKTAVQINLYLLNNCELDRETNVAFYTGLCKLPDIIDTIASGGDESQTAKELSDLAIFMIHRVWEGLLLAIKKVTGDSEALKRNNSFGEQAITVVAFERVINHALGILSAATGKVYGPIGWPSVPAGPKS